MSYQDLSTAGYEYHLPLTKKVMGPINRERGFMMMESGRPDAAMIASTCMALEDSVRCRENMAHIRQSRPDSDLGLRRDSGVGLRPDSWSLRI